ncbi:MAG TPA: cob(I)yrinic acid a,c-diamide adenosyltransferase [Syntrophales bacterium]|nr:cob(I)yrinic acid a,c-diamide adenosyltransferase [Syntrophales bacterium]
MKQGKRILLFTGDGKGKTTAALGMALRASGHGMKTMIIQFVKSDPSTGELSACRNLPGCEIVQTGKGFVPAQADAAFKEHVRAAAEGMQLAAKAISEDRYDLVILDEVCTAVAKGLIAVGEVIEIVKRDARGPCVVLTGRNAPAELISLADTVTDMRMVKHGFKAGWEGREGVEY